MLIMLMQDKDKIRCFKHKENTFSKYRVLKGALKKEGTFCYWKKDNLGSTIQVLPYHFQGIYLAEALHV